MTDVSFTVFEASNQALREAYLGVTRLPMFETVARLRLNPPAAIRHWDINDVTHYGSIEFRLSATEATLLVEEERKKPLEQGWRRLRDVSVEAEPAPR